MRDEDGRGVAPGRTWSLRREWSRAFTIMLVLLLAAALTAIVGTLGLVAGLRGTTTQLRHETLTVDALETHLVAHEEVGHKLLSGEHVNLAAYIAQQHQLSAMFDRATTSFPSDEGMRAIIVDAHQSWQQGLMTYHLWGAQAKAMHGDHSADNPTYGVASDAANAMLGNIEGPSLEAMNEGTAHGTSLEHIQIAALAALFGLALAATVYFRRRMTRDLVRPVAGMHQGVLKLEAGDYGHRIAVARRDELGELAEAFNGMAGALHDSHVALTREASHDPLTGLPNRATLTRRLAASFSPGSDRRALHESVLFIDVDDFKDVNDSLGHEGGDELLVELAGRLNACVRPHDLVARLGGDEFAIMVSEENNGSTATAVAERILDAVRAPFIIGGTDQVVSVSIGLAQRRPEVGDAADLLRRADFAMYMAKGAGKGRYQLFDTKMHDTMVSRSALKADLALAVTSGQLRLEYQPVADLRTGEVLGVEALVRWQHPTLGLLPPADFIPLAEETGDIEALGCWVLDAAIRHVTAWRAMDHCADLWVSVNLSTYQLPNPRSLAAIRDVLTEPGVQADKVILEVTETALAADSDGGIAALTTLKELGVRLAIDDFGTGFSSLSTLANLPVDILKIDRSFISGHASGSPSVPMLEGILGLATKLSLTVIAEGIEEHDQLDLLRTLGCFTGQGFLLARPAPPSSIETMLAAGGLLRVTQPAI